LDINADEDGKYEIHSLYFDDEFNSCMSDIDHGLSRRYKYRIRYYGDNKELLHLERKEKYLERCHKDVCELGNKQFQKIMDNDIGDVLWEPGNPVLNRFGACCLARGFRPKAIIDYERTAYIEPISNIRITIDSNITASDTVNDFLIGDYIKIPVQNVGLHILEVKFDYILPSYIRHVITDKNMVRTSFSKYYFGREQLKLKG
jgi:hypothetical protein